jgi:molybdopterin-guanine dinucleotide biosynthesis protein A
LANEAASVGGPHRGGIAEITGIVLAGGMGRRMGGIDKGLVELDGRPMVAHVLARLAPQVGAVLINANQNCDRYAQFGYPVIADAVGGFAGPLAGLHAGMSEAKTALVVTVPCDSPFLPLDLVARLAAAIARDDAQLAVAQTLDQPHPVFALVRRDVLPHLASFLHGGGRKIDAWYGSLRVVLVPFDDAEDAFRNINTAAELAAAVGARGIR